jgi:hypothetical protein
MKKTNSLLALFLSLGMVATAQEPVFFNFVNAIGNGKETTLKVDEKTIGAPFREGFATGGLGFMKENVVVKLSNGDWESKAISLKLSTNDSPILIPYLGEMVDKDEKGNLLPEPKRLIQHIILPSSSDTGRPKIRAIYCGNKQEVLIQKARVGQNDPLAKSARGVFKLEKLKPTQVENAGTGTVFGFNNKQIGMFDGEVTDNLLIVFYDKEDSKDAELGMTTTLDIVFK